MAFNLFIVEATTFIFLLLNIIVVVIIVIFIMTPQLCGPYL